MTAQDDRDSARPESVELLAARFLDLWQANQVAWLSDQALNHMAATVFGGARPANMETGADQASQGAARTESSASGRSLKDA